MVQHNKIMQVSLSHLIIDPKYEEAVIAPTKDQDIDFDQSIKENGIREPLKCNNDNKVLDGHRRYRKAQKYDIQTVPVIYETFNTELEEYEYVLKVNYERRNMNETQRIIAALKFRDLEKEKAKLRQGKKTSSPNEPKGPSRDIVAKKTKVSSTKIQKVEKVLALGNKDLIEDMIEEKKSVARAYNLVNQKVRHFEDIPLPTEKQHYVLVDLPLKWDHEERGSATEHYQTYLPSEYLEKFPLEKMPFADDCVLLIWSWYGMHEEIKKIIYAWGFQIHGECIWIKTNKENKNDLAFGMGSVFRSCHETLLMCKKGSKIPLPYEKNRVRSAFLSQKLEHSEKPEYAYQILESLYPNESYMELYARGKKERKNWIFHGNELENDAPKIEPIFVHSGELDFDDATTGDKELDESIKKYVEENPAIDLTPEENERAEKHSWGRSKKRYCKIHKRELKNDDFFKDYCKDCEKTVTEVFE